MSEFTPGSTPVESSDTLSTDPGVVTTDTFTEGAGFDHDGSSYPYTIDPTETIQELIITNAGNIDMEITTTSSTTLTVPLNSTTGAFNRWSIDKVVFKDPDGTTAPLAGGWSGE